MQRFLLDTPISDSWGSLLATDYVSGLSISKSSQGDSKINFEGFAKLFIFIRWATERVIQAPAEYPANIISVGSSSYMGLGDIGI